MLTSTLEFQLRWKPVFIAIAIAILSSCSFSAPRESIFVVYLHKSDQNELLEILKEFSSKNQYELVSESFGNRAKSTASYQFLIQGDGLTFLVQSGLAEKCNARAGRRDVEYSNRYFDVNVFSTSKFLSDSSFDSKLHDFQDDLRAAGFAVMTDVELCRAIESA